MNSTAPVATPSSIRSQIYFRMGQMATRRQGEAPYVGRNTAPILERDAPSLHPRVPLAFGQAGQLREASMWVSPSTIRKASGDHGNPYVSLDGTQCRRA